MIKKLAQRDTSTFIDLWESRRTDTLSELEFIFHEGLYDDIFKSNPESLVNKLHKAEHIPLNERIHFLERSIYSAFLNKPLFYSLTDIGRDLAEMNDDLHNVYFFINSKITIALMSKDFESMKAFIDEVEKLPLGQDSMLYASFYLQKALYAKAVNQDSVSEYFDIVLDVGSRFVDIIDDSLKMVTTYRDYADYMVSQGEIEKATQLLLNAFHYFGEGKVFNFNRIEVNFVLSTLFLELGNLQKAEQYINETIRIADLGKFAKVRNGKCATRYGDLLLAQGNFEKAIEEYERAEKFYKQGWINKSDPKRAYFNLSIAHLDSENDEEAEYWFKKGVQINDDDKVASYLKNLYLAKKNARTHAKSISIGYALNALETSKVLKSKAKEKEMLYLLYTLYKGNGDYTSSLNYLEAYNNLDKELYRSGQELAVNQLQSEYQIDIKEEQIKTLNIENELTGQKLEAQKRITIFSTIGLILVSILLLSLFRLVKKFRAQNLIISKASADKEILLKEIHHRVKNNLQVISSLLKLQSRYINDDSAIKAIADGRTRVQSMALLHQNLYQEDNLKGVRMKDYFENLTQGLFDAYNINGNQIQLYLEIEDIILDVDTVIPLGLITNELVSNALKHAFNTVENGKIKVVLKEEVNQLVLEVSDNGAGGYDKESKNGFGSMLIESLSNKLEAKIEKSVLMGTRIRISIDNYKKAA